MPHKHKLTTTQILIALREQLLTARSEKNRVSLNTIQNTCEHLLEMAYAQRDGEVAGILQNISDSVRDTIMGVEWKSETPSIENILMLETSSAEYINVQASIIRRAVMKDESRPPSLGYTPNKTGEYEIIDPDWVGIARANGPYKNTFDLLCYKSDGKLISYTEFETLESAIRYAQSKCGILDTDWEVCDIEIKNEDGRVV